MRKSSIIRTAYILPSHPRMPRLGEAIADLGWCIYGRAELGDIAGVFAGVDNRPRKGATKVRITVTVEEIQ